MIKSINTPLTEDITTELKAGDSIRVKYLESDVRSITEITK